MASNIKIVGNIISTTTVSRYNKDDIKLIPSKKLQENFGGTGDYIEYYAYDIAGNLLSTNYNYLNYKLPTDIGLTPGTNTPPNTTDNIQTSDVGIDSTLATPTSSLYPIIEIDPVQDLQNLGYTSGEFNVRYNLFQTKISDYINEALFIKEISPDRTELRLASTILTNEQIESSSLALISEIDKANYYVDYLLNFGNNEQYVTVNIALNKAPEGYEILFKLYQPLPLSIQEKTTLWIVEEKVSPYVFDINLDKLITPAPGPRLRGPNFDIEIPNNGTVSTQYNTYNNLVSSLQSLQNSSYQQILNLLATQSVDINIDYTNYNEFIFFGSAYQRLSNFYTKVKEIEDYSNFITKYTPYTTTTASLLTTINQYSSSISTIITQFDGYESYLYFESSSYTWPKLGPAKPYSLLSTGSTITINWYNTQTGSAKEYDDNNYNNLEYAIPTFVKDDPTNQPFLTFLNMVGQYFDNIWIYLNSITDINLANNNLEAGISKDLVYERLKSLGLHLYNSQAGEDVSQYLVGANTGSSTWDNNTTITGSYLNNIPRKDLVSELYKRIYHNLPLLAKTKGTVAGLDHLMTIFGIQNQTYYTVGTESFYTPIGNSVTASILNVKEFGGSLKSNLISGYNNDKVRIIPNTIFGNVLSPLLSLQTFPTASAAFRENDMHYVDVSFSPETQIDTYISGAIASNNPTWSLDDYIGDPRQQYYTTYPDLDAQRKLYFETGVPGYAPFTGSLLDYSGFIRLIQYFDNALFKMLADFVPERTSLSTGVTINSPVLERNKAVYANPTNTTKQTVYEPQYSPVGISAQYGFLYDNLWDKKSFFDGNLEGSTVDVHQYFVDNYNPYLGNWTVYNNQHTITQSINNNTFLHSDWNVLLNNVSKSIVSIPRKKIEYVWGTTGSITSSAELQDSYLSLQSYRISRYEGSKLTSLTYNTYTSASYSNGLTIQNGDISYGKTAVIDRKSYKIGWVKNLPSQSLNFYDKTSIGLKYLVDANSNTLDLSLKNNNLFEVQNTFKSGTPVVLSVSDVQKPSFQKTLDGTKTIFKGGYSYDPILFRENNETLTFISINALSSTTINYGIKAFCNDSYGYAAQERTNAINAIPFRPADNYDDGGIGNSGNGSYLFFHNNSLSDTTGKTMAVTYFQGAAAWVYNSTPACSTNIWGGNVRNNPRFVYGFNLLDFTNIIAAGGYNTEPDSTTYSPAAESNTLSGQPNTLYKVPRAGTYTVNSKIEFRLSADDSGNPNWNGYKGAEFAAFCVVEKSTNPTQESSWYNQGTPLAVSKLEYIYHQNDISFDASSNSIRFDNVSAYIALNMKINYAQISFTSAEVAQGVYVRLRFYLIDKSNLLGGSGGKRLEFYINGDNNNPPAGGYFEIYDNTAYTTYNYQTQYFALPPLFTLSSANSIIFDASATALFNNSFLFQPEPPASNYYSPVIDFFDIQKYDLIRIGQFNNPNPIYYEVINVENVGGQIKVTFSSNITGAFNNATSFAILRPKPDETSVIINFRKSLGEVSQTVLIPYDADDLIKNSVGDIYKNLNTSLQ